MFGNGYEILYHLRILLSAVMSGLAIKLMDDFLDRHYDIEYQTPNISTLFLDASLPYALAVFGIGALLNAPVAVCLFFASYTIGMVNHLTETNPSGLKGWQEGSLLCLLGVFLTTLSIQLWALAVISFIQIVDDLIDLNTDRKNQTPNFAIKFGLGEVILVAIPLLVIALLINSLSTLLVLLAALMVEGIIRFVLTRKAGSSI